MVIQNAHLTTTTHVANKVLTKHTTDLYETMLSGSDGDISDQDKSSHECDGFDSNLSCGGIISTCIAGLVFRRKNYMWQGQASSDNEVFIAPQINWQGVIFDDESLTDIEQNFQE